MTSTRRIQINPQKCTGCRICELICAFTKHGEFNPKRSRIRIVKMERLLVDIPVVCNQCPEPFCVEHCPAGALRRDTDTTIRVDEITCTGCKLCEEACPFGAISVDPVRDVAIVCDLCGADPKCVKWCPTGALEFSPAAPTVQGKRGDAVASTAESLLRKWGIPLEEYKKYYGEPRSVAVEGKEVPDE